jgi:microcin C transport system substrate-binding protein
MRPEAKFHDGSKLTAHDVAWSLTTLKEKGHPIVTQLLRDFKAAEAADDATVIVRFAEKRARDVPLFVAGLPIFSRAYYGKQAFDQSSMDPPLGSGPYKVGKAEPGRFIEYARVKDWWGADLPVSRGQYNFDTVRYEYFRDRDVGFEAFTAKAYLLREEFTSRVWATRYDFPALREGKVKRDVPRKVQEPRAARGARRRLRLRMDQQEPDVRLLRAHPFGVPELGDDGERAAVAGRDRAARAVPRQAARRSVRRALCAAGQRRLRP